MPSSSSFPSSPTLKKGRFAEALRMVAVQLSRQQGNPRTFSTLARASSSSVVDEGPSQILPRLYLGNYFHASDEHLLRRLGVTHVVSVLEFGPPPAVLEHTRKERHGRAGKWRVKTLHIPIRDTYTADILVHLDRTTEFIHEAMRDPDAVVLVHCFQGISRSPIVVAAYLLATAPTWGEFDSAVSALHFLRQKRSIVNPNFAFVRQLEDYARLCLERRRLKIRGSLRWCTDRRMSLRR